jgi:hypothetical protein
MVSLISNLQKDAAVFVAEKIVQILLRNHDVTSRISQPNKKYGQRIAKLTLLYLPVSLLLKSVWPLEVITASNTFCACVITVRPLVVHVSVFGIPALVFWSKVQVQ